MSTQVQYRRGTGAQNNSFVGALAEITVDTTNGTLRVHNGITAGGSNIATVAYVDNAISSLSANSITDGTSSVTIIATNGNIRANVGGSTVQLLSSGGANVTGYVSATGNVSGGNLTTAGLIAATGNITGGNLSGTSIVGTLTTAAQTNITSVGTLTSLTVTGNVSGGNLTTAGAVTGNGRALTSLNASNLDTGTVPSARLSGTYTITVSGSATTAGTVTTAAQPNITSVGTLTSLTSSGNIQGANVIATADVFTPEIVKTGSNGVGNIGQSNNTFNTVFAKATSAQYADVAERYLADNYYPTGTVLVFGGSQEVTQSQIDHGTAIAGTVSDKPAYVMNNGLTGEHVVSVALLGRVPVRVIGTIRPGDLLVASELPGIATSLVSDRYAPGCVIGKALESYASEREGTIEAVVGRL